MKKADWFHYFIEFVIVLLGITVAFWLNNIAEASREKRQEAKLIQSLSEDLQKDKRQLENVIKFNQRKLDLLMRGIGYFDEKSQFDSLAFVAATIGNYNFFYPEKFTYESLRQSGDFKVLRSQKIREELMRIHENYVQIEDTQVNFISALDDNYFPEFMRHYDMINNQATNESFFESVYLKNFLAFGYNQIQNLIYHCEISIKQIEKFEQLILDEQHMN